jgi:hypothetical protein
MNDKNAKNVTKQMTMPIMLHLSPPAAAAHTPRCRKHR